jgi:hypothetical protein
MSSVECRVEGANVELMVALRIDQSANRHLAIVTRHFAERERKDRSF